MNGGNRSENENGNDDAHFGIFFFFKLSVVQEKHHHLKTGKLGQLASANSKKNVKCPLEESNQMSTTEHNASEKVGSVVFVR